METNNTFENEKTESMLIAESKPMKVATILGLVIMAFLAIFPFFRVNGAILLSSAKGNYVYNHETYYYSNAHDFFFLACIFYFTITFAIGLISFLKHKNLSAYKMYSLFRPFVYIVATALFLLQLFQGYVHIHHNAYLYLRIVAIAICIEYIVLAVANYFTKELRLDKYRTTYSIIAIALEFIFLILVLGSTNNVIVETQAGKEILGSAFLKQNTFRLSFSSGMLFIIVMSLSLLAMPSTAPYAKIFKGAKTSKIDNKRPLGNYDCVLGIVGGISLYIFSVGYYMGGMLAAFAWVIASVIRLFISSNYNKKAEEKYLETLKANASSNKANYNAKKYIWRAKALIKSNEMVVIKDKFSLPTYATKMQGKINALGISITIEEVKKLICAFASSKVVLIKVQNQWVTRKFAEVLSECFSTEFFTEYFHPKREDDDELDETQKTKNKRNGIASGFYNALYKDNYISTIHFNSYGTDASTKAEYFYESVANIEDEISLGSVHYLEETEDFNKSKITLPDNLWVVGFVDDASIEKFSKKSWINYASIVELNVFEKEKEETTGSIEILYKPFTQEVEEAQENYYFNDNNWKKIDKLNEYLNKTAGFELSNRFLRQVEKFVSTYMAMGASQDEAMDLVLSMRILPYLASKKDLLVSKNVGDFALVFDEIFGSEEISKARKAMIYFGLKK